MYIIISYNETIKTIWDKEQGKYFISIVDLVGVLSENKDKTIILEKAETRLKEENETVTNCLTLKLKAKDGKYRMTDVEVALADLERNCN